MTEETRIKNKNIMGNYMHELRRTYGGCQWRIKYNEKSRRFEIYTDASDTMPTRFTRKGLIEATAVLAKRPTADVLFTMKEITEAPGIRTK